MRYSVVDGCCHFIARPELSTLVFDGQFRIGSLGPGQIWCRERRRSAKIGGERNEAAS
jgi:hypothetical protein